MIKTPLSTVLGGAFWTPSTTILGSASKTFDQIIQSLFANSEQGFVYNPNDLSTMFQDSAGTVPVTGAGQPVGLIRDKSGRNNHAYQTTSASRPILRQNAVTGANYLEFDGSDDFLQTNNINFTATDKVSLFAGVRKLSDGSPLIIFELGPSTATTDGTFHVATPSGAGLNDYAAYSRGTVRNQCATNSAFQSPTSTVLSTKMDIVAPLIKLRANGIEFSSALNQGTGKYSSNPLYIGRRGGTSFSFNGHLYSLIGVGRLTTDNETTALEKELAKRLGVTLSV